MPATRRQQARVLVQTALPWRRAWGHRSVRRSVQGVELVMPWSHMLPDYARMRPGYGQNLVELAAGLARRSPSPLTLLDVGANIGDSTVQILARAGGRALAVEADPYWADYLRRNVGSDPRVSIEEVLLTADDGDWASSAPVREHGTTRFVQDSAQLGALATLTTAQLRARHPDFDDLRLVKSDTDGFDVTLIPALAETWRDRHPVLFFEFDPGLTRQAGTPDPQVIWPRLAELGYHRLAVWDNTGDPLGRLSTSAAAEQAVSLEPRPIELGYHFWDVAAVHEDDEAGLDTLAQLVPQAFSVLGTWR